MSAEDERALLQLARAERVDGVIAPGIDWPVAIASRIAAHLGLPHPLAPETAALAVSKQRQRERFGEAGVPQPRWRAAVAGADDLPLPAVVKPSDRQGQKGLTLVHERSELAAAIELAVSESRSGYALVEEYVDGPELTVNGFSVGGRFHALTVTDRLTAEPLSVLEKRLLPFGFIRVHRGELIRASAVRSLRVRDGVLEAELEDGQVARVSRRSVAALKARLGLG